jgi:hypothetical protein
MRKKTLLVAGAAAAAALTWSVPAAAHGGEAVAGMIVGGGIGAAVGGPPGAAVGAFLGAIIGTESSPHPGYGDRSLGYYEPRHYGPPPAAYRPAPTYYNAPPAYYNAPPAYSGGYSQPQSYGYDRYAPPRGYQHAEYQRAPQQYTRDERGYQYSRGYQQYPEYSQYPQYPQYPQGGGYARY